MICNTLHTLSQPWQSKISQVFAVDAGDITIQFSPWPTLFGAEAVAYGSQVYLSPECLRWCPGRQRRLLAHELAHVIQQKRGLVRPDQVQFGWSVNRDQTLEDMADDWATCLLSDEQRPSPTLPPKQAITKPVVQCHVTLAEKPIMEQSQLTPISAMALGMIHQGGQWLEWAMGVTQQTFAFVNEADLVQSVQQGLHGQPVLLLSAIDLPVGPSCLLTLEEAQLEALAEVQVSPTSKTAASRAMAVVEAQGWLTSSDLDIVPEFLKEVQLNDHPLFQWISGGDRLQLVDFLKHGRIEQDPTLWKRAAKYAVERAMHVPSFIDYFSLFSLLSEFIPTGLTAPRKRSEMAKLTDDLDRRMLPFLSSVFVGRYAELDAIAQRIKTLAGVGGRMGYQRLSQAVLAMAHHTDFSPKTSGRLAAYFEAGLQGQMNRLQQPEHFQSVAHQDGQTRTIYEKESDQPVAVIDGLGQLAFAQGYGAKTKASTVEKNSPAEAI